MAIWIPDVDSSEEFYSEFENQREQDHKSYQEMTDEINKCIRSGTDTEAARIGDIIDSREYERLSGLFYGFKVFKTSHIIYDVEREAGITNNIYAVIEDIADYNDLRQCALYCFRRIQMMCSDEEIAALFEELIRRDVSVYFVIRALNEAKLSDRGFVGKRLSELYNQYGKRDEALILGSYCDRKFPDSECSFRIEEPLGIKPYSGRKICFITCVNNRRMYEECLFYINRLIVPEGVEIDSLSIEEAESMTSGYNAGMIATDADIKIYLHQDVCIIDPFFLFRIIDVFDSDKDIGVIGIVGSPELPKDTVMWHGIRIGKLYDENTKLHYSYAGASENALYDPVEAVDGLLIATSRDIPWRDDVFDGWDFYDASVCAEFRRQGLKVVVPKQETPWVIHDDGMMNLYSYGKYRKLFIETYLTDRKVYFD